MSVLLWTAIPLVGAVIVALVIIRPEKEFSEVTRRENALKVMEKWTRG